VTAGIASVPLCTPYFLPRDGWGLSGMLTEFFRPAEPTTRRITETTFVIEKKVSERASLFVEYVGDYPSMRARANC
jgi:FAD/FMN-containing dehydrogenase